jgi:hypothetical protein
LFYPYIGSTSGGFTAATPEEEAALPTAAAVVQTTVISTTVSPDTDHAISGEINDLTLAVFFPANAISAPATLVVTGVEDTTMPDEYSLLGSMVDVQVQDATGIPLATLSQPMTLTIGFGRVIADTLQQPNVSLQVWNAAQESWEAIPVIVNLADHTITAVLSGPATLAVLQNEEASNYLIYLPTIQR